MCLAVQFFPVAVLLFIFPGTFSFIHVIFTEEWKIILHFSILLIAITMFTGRYLTNRIFSGVSVIYLLLIKFVTCVSLHSYQDLSHDKRNNLSNFAASSLTKKVILYRIYHGLTIPPYSHLCWGSASSLMPTVSDTLRSMKGSTAHVSGVIRSVPCITLAWGRTIHFIAPCLCNLPKAEGMAPPPPLSIELCNLFPHSSSTPQRRRLHAVLA